MNLVNTGERKLVNEEEICDADRLEEELVTYAAQEIRVALDYKAIRLGYQQALRNGNNYVVKFNAAVGSADEGINSFGYKQNAQTFTSAISKLEDVMLNDIRTISVAA